MAIFESKPLQHVNSINADQSVNTEQCLRHSLSLVLELYL